MHFVIMGCGRVGSTIARSLEKRGHDVAVVDQNAAAFRRLGASFEGTCVKGVGFDRDTLRRAGITEAHAFAALSSGDNSNILAARVARETFGVKNVVARIYDPGRAEIYERLGIPTVATVRWAADQALRYLLPDGYLPEFMEPSGRVVLANVAVSDSWVGHRLAALEEFSGARIAYVSRLGEGMVPDMTMPFQDGDQVHFTVAREDVAALAERLQQAPVTSEGN